MLEKTIDSHRDFPLSRYIYIYIYISVNANRLIIAYEPFASRTSSLKYTIAIVVISTSIWNARARKNPPSDVPDAEAALAILNVLNKYSSLSRGEISC